MVVRAIPVSIPAPIDGRLTEGRLTERFVASGNRSSRARASAVSGTMPAGEALRAPWRVCDQQRRLPTLHGRARTGPVRGASNDGHPESPSTLSQATLRAPVAGVISGVYALPGAGYDRGWMVVTIGAGEWLVRFAAGRATASSLLSGTVVIVRPVPGGTSRPGVVLSVPPLAAVRSMPSHVEAVLCDDGTLPAGLPVRVSISVNEIAAGEPYAECRGSHRALLDGGAPTSTAPSPGE